MALVGGVVLGLLVPVGLASVPEDAATRTTERVMTAGGANPAAFPSIGAALARAHRGDIVQVEPGEYAESLTIPEGVELRAAKPGKVVLVAPAGAERLDGDRRGRGRQHDPRRSHHRDDRSRRSPMASSSAPAT